MTSKTVGDSLPLTSFKLEKKPCLDPTKQSTDPSARFYPTELDRKNNDCVLIEQFNETYDTRYADAGTTVTEYDVQDESKVLDKLEDLPNIGMYVDLKAKKNIKYGFWSRPTISWSIDCDD